MNQPDTPTQNPAPLEQQYVIFQIDGEDYGVAVTDVLKIVNLAEVVPIPNSPDYLVGFLNLSGSVIPLVDLEVKFGLQRGEEQRQEKKVIVIDNQESAFGILVDTVSEVLTTTADKVNQAPDAVMQKLGQNFLQGVIVLSEESQEEKTAEDQQQGENQRIVLVLQAKNLLSEHEKQQISEQQAPPSVEQTQN